MVYTMEHKMKLWNDSFIAIKNGTKTVEMRLNDEKRRMIQNDDIIVFHNTLTGEELRASVVGVKTYKDFYELYDHYDKISIGYESHQAKNPADMYDYYSKEQIETYGALAIEIKLI